MENKLFDLSGKVSVITGGNGGIGLGIAEGLASCGGNGARLCLFSTFDACEE